MLSTCKHRIDGVRVLLSGILSYLELSILWICRKENPMSPYTIVVILFLSSLFFILSIIPLLEAQSGTDPSHRSPGGKKKSGRLHGLRKI